ncbi:MAG: hypothetical protein KDG52_09755 [Rhodocyclaceae bacterium]|nr:hypothetical protein [Rhodocyclaceae bacterium]
MLTVVPVCLLMLALTTLIHYEALSWMARRLPALPLPSRFKVVVVLPGAFVAHVVEIALYFSGETFTSLA